MLLMTSLTEVCSSACGQMACTVDIILTLHLQAVVFPVMDTTAQQQADLLLTKAIKATHLPVIQVCVRMGVYTVYLA